MLITLVLNLVFRYVGGVGGAGSGGSNEDIFGASMSDDESATAGLVTRSHFFLFSLFENA